MAKDYCDTLCTRQTYSDFNVSSWGILATNAAAAALYRKVGFVEEGIKRKAILIDGIYHDEIIMARLKP